MNTEFILLDDCIILVYNDYGVNPLFIKVNSYLLKKYYNDSIDHISNQEKVDFLVSWWSKEFGVDVTVIDLKPKILKFNSKDELLLFLIKADSLS
jgi:hypothetical protein